jgi:hypothetical protein
MGMYSQRCQGICGGREIFAAALAEPTEEWMTHAVVITPSGSILRGTYDGYGRVDGREDAIGVDNNTVYHEACWELAGKPTAHVGASRGHAFMQGGIFELPDGYAVPDPRTWAPGYVPADVEQFNFWNDVLT